MKADTALLGSNKIGFKQVVYLEGCYIMTLGAIQWGHRTALSAYILKTTSKYIKQKLAGQE